MGQPLENTDSAASTEETSVVETVQQWAQQAYEHFSSTPPNAEAPVAESENQQLPGLTLVEEANESAKLGGSTRVNSERTSVLNAVPNAEGNVMNIPEKMGVDGVLRRGREAANIPGLDKGDVRIVQDALSLSDGQFDKGGLALSATLRQVEAAGGPAALKERIHQMNAVMEADGSRYQLQVQGAKLPEQRGLFLRDGMTGKVSDSVPFGAPLVRPMMPTRKTAS